MRDGGFLIGTYVDYQGNQTSKFSLKVTGASDGLYQCKVTAGGSTGVSNSINLSAVTPASNTRVTSVPSPAVAYEGSRIILSCVVSRGTHLSYTWFFNREEVTSSASTFQINGNKLVLEKVTPEHAGNYYCIAWSTVQNIKRISTSREIQVTIKVYISKPKISFSIFKHGNGYYGNVTCWSSRGSPPANFSLSVDDRVVGSQLAATETLVAWFQVAMVPGLDMGEARCQGKTEMQDLMSEPVTLQIVPVGGDVKVEVDYLYTAKAKLAAVRLRCQISRGTFPYIIWVFNNSDVPSEFLVNSYIQPLLSHFTLTDHRQSLILTKPSPKQSGYYRCKARDDYEYAGPWVKSAAVLLQVTDRILNSMLQATSTSEMTPKLSMTSIEAITVAFCCFFLLMLVVGSACVYKMFGHQRVLRHISPEK
ncbi:Fc receptor-like protein 5 [Xenentodon cancila]